MITEQGVTLLTLATTIPSMRPPPCTDSRTQQCIEANGSQLAMFYAALYTTALGGGGIKSNVSAFTMEPKENAWLLEVSWLRSMECIMVKFQLISEI
ncbi:Protein NRT1/ PTR FAMILY 6.4 [Camellia lanceoleosa]|uniref:Protein NRT1/ PTR FAMILY 6.4 n=1 Tax=Camellia lanceoleosa TaxID=1840588 RepID=A0ACC0FQV8_9ERIC|nr:Protein NRT1/ PTR FAMILY 6.4 [Camellia lanceoleosa]